MRLPLCGHLTPEQKRLQSEPGHKDRWQPVPEQQEAAVADEGMAVPVTGGYQGRALHCEAYQPVQVQVLQQSEPEDRALS